MGKWRSLPGDYRVMTNRPIDFGNDLEEAGDSALEGFISTIVATVVRGSSLANVYALAEILAPDLMGALPMENDQDPEARAAIARLLARDIADHTPQPALRFATRKYPQPGRNDPCDCGSGRKYKHCCQIFAQHSATARMNLLPHVLDNLPRTRWAELVGSAIDPRAVADVARGMLEDYEPENAAALIEPWFNFDAAIPAAHEELLDALLDAYTDMDKPRKKRQLLEQALARGDRAIRSSMRQRLATMAADEGDYPLAWQHFRDAQREDADSASLSHLEVTLLLAQGEHVQVRERARFWIARLQRTDAHAHMIAFLRDVAEQGEQALFNLQTAHLPELAELPPLLQAAPQPAVCHTLRGGDATDAGVLAPDRALARALQDWTLAFPQVGPALTSLWLDDHPAWDNPQPWLHCLRQHPLLWQSFDVLDDLVLALTAIYQLGMAPLRDHLLERGETLLRMTLDQHQANHKTLEWGHMANRPALRLIAQRIAVDERQPDDETLARMEWLLLLNPGDNHGYREEVTIAWLQRDQPARALSLIERYPDDSSLAFSRVLALYALGRTDDALRALQDAHTDLPRVAPLLVAAKPKKPKLTPGSYRYGGEGQAWLLRETALPAWQRIPGALDWLRKSLKLLKA